MGMSEKASLEDVQGFIDVLLGSRSLDDQVGVLRDCLAAHALGHPWVDDELRHSILENIARRYGIEADADDEGRLGE
jgi:hypothetical protein